MTKLIARKKGDNVATVSFHDNPFSEGILIDSDTYGPLDRTYDAKGLETMFIKLSNIGGANAVTYKIIATQVEFTKLSNLTPGDFTKVLEVEASIGFGANVEFTEDLMGPEITAVRIQLKRTSAGLDTTLQGIVSAD